MFSGHCTECLDFLHSISKFEGQRVEGVHLWEWQCSGPFGEVLDVIRKSMYCPKEEGKNSIWAAEHDLKIKAKR